MRNEAGKSTLTTVALIGAVIIFGLPLLASLGPGFVKTAIATNAPAARDLTCTYPVNHVCPANANRADAENAARGRPTTRATTAPTTVAQPRPYGPPNGPVRELPSARPPAPANPTPEPDAGSNLPQLGEAPTGGILGRLPVVGRALTEGLKALPPGAEGG